MASTPLPIESHQGFTAARQSGRSVPLSAERAANAKMAFSCRRVPLQQMQTLINGARPNAGDLVLARVVRKRQHPRIELLSGRKASLFIGDEIIVCYGNRYATDQFEAVVPQDLGPCHLVASGGVAATVLSRTRGVKPATEIVPVGLIGDRQGQPLNLSAFAIAPSPQPYTFPPCIAVAGSAMNAGKTTSAAQLVKGLGLAGYRVGAAKVTGTGSGGDYWKLLDAGACAVADFTDAGLISTFKVSLEKLEQVVADLTEHLQDHGAEVIVLEVADGLLQEETAALLQSATMRQRVSGYLLAVTDPLGVVSARDWMERHDLPLIALCGTLTRSALAVREAINATSLPVLTLRELRTPEIAALVASESKLAELKLATNAK